MNNNILIFALSRTPWIGGIYYRKNIVHMLLSDQKIMDKFGIVILVNEKHKAVFEPFGDAVTMVVCPDSTNVPGAMLAAFKCCMKYRVKYVFPLMPFGFLKLLGITPVSWIADFQHCHYPEFFEQSEIDKRNSNFNRIKAASNPLVLSSQDAKNDFETYFSKDRGNVHVVHFSSYIGDELQKLEKADEDGILSGFGLEKFKYVAVCNQFWKHKNHIVVLKAIEKLSDEHPEFQIRVVFTGEPSDRRNPEYMDELKKLFDSPGIKERTSILGFIGRTEQLCVMKYARFIIQPSLFEGWGTVVEDCKILGKNIVLSDIPVHSEQMNDNCLLFEARNETSLADAIIKMDKRCNCSNGETCDMAVTYAKEFEKIFF